MKIFFNSTNYTSTKQLQKQRFTTPIKANSSDTISFGNTNKQFYRGIGENELDMVLGGGVVEPHDGFCTDNNKGWRGYFKSDYFITFKKDFAQNNLIEERDDARWKIEKYKLSDIENIRTGSNVDGKIVYSNQWPLEQKMQLAEIKIQKHLACLDTSSDKSDKSLKILTNYSKDHPELVDKLPIHLYNSATEAKKDLITLLLNAGRKEDCKIIDSYFSDHILKLKSDDYYDYNFLKKIEKYYEKCNFKANANTVKKYINDYELEVLKKIGCL